MKKDSKIYLAGNNGLIGSAIKDSLYAGGYDNLVGYSPDTPNLMDRKEVRNFFKREKPEYVILTSTGIGENQSDEAYRADVIYQNLHVQNSVIGESFTNEVKKLLLVGNISIYPDNIQQPISEDQLLTSTLSYNNEPYAIAKIAAIKMSESFNLQYGTNYLVATPATIYGPNDNFDLIDGHIIPTLIRKMHLAKCVLENSWSTLYRDIKRRLLNGINGSSTLDELVKALDKYGIHSNNLELNESSRPMSDFLWSGDFANACIFMLNNVDFNGSSNFNIGTGKETSIKQLADIVADVVGYTGKVKFAPAGNDESTSKLMDVSKINNLGWKYSTELEEGIFLLYQWYLRDQE